jgi:hypothetical protein
LAVTGAQLPGGGERLLARGQPVVRGGGVNAMNMRSRLIVSVVAITALNIWAGCQTAKGTSALGGAGLGALIGAAAGDTQGALIGAAVGTGVGYIIGDQVDEKRAKEMSAQGTTHNEVGPLGGTKWRVASINSTKSVAPYTSKEIEFRPDGRVITMTTGTDGKTQRADESYRVVGDTLIVNKPGYLVNAKYKLDGEKLIVTDPGFTAVVAPEPA